MSAQIHFPGVVTEQPWRREAACRENDRAIFFPDPSDRITLRLAQAICGECPVRRECGEFGRDELYGVWGGAYKERQTRERRAS